MVELGRLLGCSGFVAESVPLAIFASQRIADRGLVEVFTEVIATGGDTDTIASITGQIAGAWLRFDNIPKELIERVEDSASVLRIADALVQRLETPH